MQSEGGLSWLEIIAGACGAIIPVAMRSNLSPRQVLVMLFIGMAIAVFGAPAAFDYFQVTNQHFRAFLVLVIGMGSMSLCEAAMKWIDANAYPAVAKLAGMIPFLRGLDRRKKQSARGGRRRATDKRRKRR